MTTIPPGGTSPPAQSTQPEMAFIQHEPPMTYQPPSKAVNVATLPVHEPGPLMVTSLTQVGDKPADVDCPYCKRAVKTEVKKPEAGDDTCMRVMICLVCCPFLLCYEGETDTEHWCTVCKRRLTYQPGGRGKVQVVASEEPQFVPSKYGPGSEG